MCKPNYKRAMTTGWEDYCLANVSYFTATTFLGRGQYERHQFTTEQDAVDFCMEHARKRPWALYAITADGRDAHIGNVTNYSELVTCAQ